MTSFLLTITMKFYSKSICITLVLYSLVVCFFSSCSEQRRTFVKNYPVDTPFVFSNKIILKGNLPKDEKNKLLTELPNYWADSLAVRKVQQIGFFYKLRNPPVFDTTALRRSITQMNDYLNSQGYYYAQLQDSFYITRFKQQQRAFVIMTIDPGKNFVVDSVAYAFSDSTMQQLALQNLEESKLRKGTAYSKQLISTELDRLITLFREHGYLQLTRDNVYALVDTTDKALLQLTLDPFEQARRIEEAAEKRKKNPTIDVAILDRVRNDSLKNKTDSARMADSAAFRQYYIGNIYYYPETKATDMPDSIIAHPSFARKLERREFTMYDNEGKFTPRPLRDLPYLRRRVLFDETLYYKTLNNLGSIGAWGQVDGRTKTRGDSVDVHIFLVPAIKQNITADLEASRNTGDIITSGSLFGIAANLTYRDRNVWKRAIQSVTSLRGGVELNLNQQNRILQTFQASLGHSYNFPRFITPFRIKNRSKLDMAKTVFNINGAYTDRHDFFRLRSLVTNWGYEWKKKNKAWQYKPINIELYSLDTLKGLDTAFKTNPYLRTAFNTGSVISQILTYNVSYKTSANTTHFIRFGLEEAGSLLGRIKSLQGKIYQYVRLEGEYRRLIELPRTQVALRAFAGVGYNYSNDPRFGKTLPFFKQFIAGGPNSMRAWGLRQLGLGSSLVSDTSGSFRDRYGDMQLELNAEYRYPIATIGTMKVNGALFTDVGNIWGIRKDTTNPNSEFSISRLGKDIAIGVGTGIRLDFNYFLIRVDFGIKLKDPARLSNNGWLDIGDFTWRNKEFTIYDATDANHRRIISRNNYAVQLGIGLPF